MDLAKYLSTDATHLVNIFQPMQLGTIALIDMLNFFFISSRTQFSPPKINFK